MAGAWEDAGVVAGEAPFDAAWDDAGLDAAWHDAEPQQTHTVEQSTTNIKAALVNQHDPRFTNSNFFRFISGLNTGELQLTEDKTLVTKDEATGEMVEATEAMYESAWD
jgi:hypothetical protein